MDEEGNTYGDSKIAARTGITAVTFSRIGMAIPGMFLTPVLMDFLDRRGVIKRIPWASAPIQTLFCGFCLTFATPLCCALFSQKASIDTASLEPEIQEKIRKAKPNLDVVYYNKGL
jgi:sideroflexin-1/3